MKYRPFLYTPLPGPSTCIASTISNIPPPEKCLLQLMNLHEHNCPKSRVYARVQNSFLMNTRLWNRCEILLKQKKNPNMSFNTIFYHLPCLFTIAPQDGNMILKTGSLMYLIWVKKELDMSVHYATFIETKTADILKEKNRNKK